MGSNVSTEDSHKPGMAVDGDVLMCWREQVGGDETKTDGEERICRLERRGNGRASQTRITPPSIPFKTHRVARLCLDPSAPFSLLFVVR